MSKEGPKKRLKMRNEGRKTGRKEVELRKEGRQEGRKEDEEGR
jgi:hypothetical protein